MQADWIPEGVNSRVFITSPPGCEEDDPEIVYEVLRPLYGIPSSARALHLTLDSWFKGEGFSNTGFETSVWFRKAGGEFGGDLIVSAHIDDCLMACSDRDVLERFKKKFLSCFDGTDEGPVTQYLGCELIRDAEAKMGTLRQKL